jgi:hypothetical protein
MWLFFPWWIVLWFLFLVHGKAFLADISALRDEDIELGGRASAKTFAYALLLLVDPD